MDTETSYVEPPRLPRVSMALLYGAVLNCGVEACQSIFEESADKAEWQPHADHSNSN